MAGNGRRSVVGVALMGVSHWHTPFFWEPLRTLDDIRLAAVSDPNPDADRLLADRSGCAWFADHRELLATIRPDFAFALAPHAGMPSLGHDLIRAGVGLLWRNPAARPERKSRDCAMQPPRPAPWRRSRWRFGTPICCEPFARPRREKCFATYRFDSSPGHRSDTSTADASGCWALGGQVADALSIWAVHCFDLYALLTGGRPSVVGATMSNATCGLPVEDYSAVSLSRGSADGVVETGYTVPGPTGSFDLRFSLRSGQHHVTATGADAAGDDHLVIYAADGTMEVLHTPTSQVPCYAAFVRQTLDRFRHGQPPLADVSDMSTAMEVVKAAYVAAGRRAPP